MAQPNGTSSCRLTVAGPLACSVIEAIQLRFDASATRTAVGTVLTVDGVDQAAIRALMIMLWDSGHQVVEMSIPDAGVAAPDAGGEAPDDGVAATDAGGSAQTRVLGCADSDQTKVSGSGDRFLPGRDTEFAVEALVVSLDGVDGQKHRLSDLPLARRPRQDPQDR